MLMTIELLRIEQLPGVGALPVGVVAAAAGVDGVAVAAAGVDVAVAATELQVAVATEKDVVSQPREPL